MAAAEQENAQRLFERARSVAFEAAPKLAAAIAFIAGALTLLTVATPALDHVQGLDFAERLIEEMPELTASIVGVVLMGLAAGLARRVDAAWAVTTVLMVGVCLYAITRHGDVWAGALAGCAAVLLGLSRRAFYRHSHLIEIAPDPRLALAIAAAFGAALLGALLWAGARPGFAEAPWWALLADPHLGRPGRALAIGALAALAIAGQRYLVARKRGAPAPPADADFARAEALLAQAPDAWPDAQLAFTGDKSLIFTERAFIAAARGGASLIAMGPPVGARADWRAALAELRAEAEKLSLGPVVYAAPPELLPDLLDIGFRVEKVGENAIVELADFSLAGPARQKLRAARRRFVEREGAAFEVLSPPHAAPLWDELRVVSNAWLAGHGGKEKAFSLGAFDPAYLARQPIAVVRKGGRIIAFANLWITHDRARGALDLMRHVQDAPGGLMDFLFTEILLWAQGEGLKRFDLGMAPLSGMAEDQYASLFARIARLVHQHGESFYGFKGLQAFKDKFGPRWEPRYIAAPGAWTLPLVLAEVARLTNEGPR